MLESRNVKKMYLLTTAVKDISLKIEPGKVYALLGPNGSGKTTWMKMAAGLAKPSDGSITYNGEPLSHRAKAEIAYMPTEPYFYNYMTVKDVGFYFRDFFADFDIDKFRAMALRMELDWEQKAKSLSSGQMAKLKIAVTMSRKAKVFLLDEPLNGIDLLSREEILNAVLEAVSPDTAIVISSHLVEELERITDVAIFVKNGEVAQIVSVEDLREAHQKSITGLYKEIYGHVEGYIC